jgi:hypothetical protein
MKYEKAFRKDHPETVGETDQTFDKANYTYWLESQLEKVLDFAESMKEYGCLAPSLLANEADNIYQESLNILSQIEII